MELIKTNVNYQSDINVGLIGIKKEVYEAELMKLEKSSFSQEYQLEKERADYGKYAKASFKKIKKMMMIKEDIFNDNNDNNDLIINIFYCENNLNNDKKKYYEEFLKEKLDCYLLFNPENMDFDFLNKIYKYSKGNYFKINYSNYCPTNALRANEIENFELINDFELIDDNTNNIDYSTFKFDKFLINLISKFEMFRLFQKYSVEKNIVHFKDYLHALLQYSKIQDEKEFFELFNKFEKFSYNDDYTDNELIMIQIMSSDKQKFNNDINFNVKSNNCGFCSESLNICEFDPEVKTFLCPNCRYSKYNYDVFSIKMSNNLKK